MAGRVHVGRQAVVNAASFLQATDFHGYFSMRAIFRSGADGSHVFIRGSYVDKKQLPPAI
jgi:hypothetical protein